MAATAAGVGAGAGAAAAEHEHEHRVKFDPEPHVLEDGARDRSRSRERARNHQSSSSSSRHERREHSPTESSDSGDTIEEPDLADRFDEHGNRRDGEEDPLARKIGEIIAGHGGGGLGGLLDDLFNSGGGHSHDRGHH